MSKAESPFLKGNTYFIRTVTYHLVGTVKTVVGKFLVLDPAAWVADSGRFQQAIDDGVLEEVEPVKCDVFVNIDSIVDAYMWAHPIPREQQ